RIGSSAFRANPADGDRPFAFRTDPAPKSNPGGNAADWVPGAHRQKAERGVAPGTLLATLPCEVVPGAGRHRAVERRRLSQGTAFSGWQAAACLAVASPAGPVTRSSSRHRPRQSLRRRRRIHTFAIRFSRGECPTANQGRGVILIIKEGRII